MLSHQNIENARIRSYIRRISEGDSEALSLLYDEMVERVYSLCLSILEDSSEAEDATQDVFIRIWDKAEAMPEDTPSPVQWLLTITRHHCIDQSRKISVRSENEKTEKQITPNDQIEQVEDRLTALHVMRLIQEICPKTLAVVKMQYFQGYSYAEISDIIGEPEPTIKTRVRRTLARIRSTSKKRGFTLSDQNADTNAPDSY